MPQFLCRAMCAQDLPAVAAIEARVPDGWSADGLAAALDAACTHCFVACAQTDTDSAHAQPLAFAAFTVVADEANLDALSVDAAHRRQGAARALLLYACKALHAQGALSLYLEARSQNTPALALYKALGLTVCGKRPHFYQNPPDDAVLMTGLLPLQPEGSRDANHRLPL